MTTSTTWPAVAEYLRAGMEAAIGDSVFVQKGPQPQWTKGKTLVFALGRPAVSRRVAAGQDYSKRLVEVYTMRCWAYSWAEQGDGTTFDDRIADVEQILADLRDFMDQDDSCGGLVTQALLAGADQWTPSNLDDNPGVDCVFYVQVEATI